MRDDIDLPKDFTKGLAFDEHQLAQARPFDPALAYPVPAPADEAGVCLVEECDQIVVHQVEVAAEILAAAEGLDEDLVAELRTMSQAVLTGLPIDLADAGRLIDLADCCCVDSETRQLNVEQTLLTFSPERRQWFGAYVEACAAARGPSLGG